MHYSVFIPEKATKGENKSDAHIGEDTQLIDLLCQSNFKTKELLYRC